MESSLKIALGIFAGALIIGLLGMPVIAQTGFGGMMGGGTGMMSAAGGMMGGRTGAGMMGNAFAGGLGSGGAGMMGGNLDMNAMHKAMHGEEPDVDMNQMHARMIAGNLTQEDWKEMKEHCPMHGGNQTWK